MKRRSTQSLVVVLLATGLGQAQAKRAPVSAKIARSSNVSVGTRSLSSLNEKVSGDTHEAMAREFLRAHREEFRLSESLADLRLAAVVETPVGFHVRFSQSQAGLPVLDAGLVVTLNRSGEVIHAMNQYRPEASRFQLPKNLGKFSDLQAGARRVLGLSATAPLSSKQNLIVSGGVSRLAYRMNDGKGREVWIDAINGRALSQRSTRYYAREAGDVQALAFDPNPAIKNNAVYGTTFTDANNADTDFFTASLSPVVLHGLSVDDNGLIALKSRYAEVVDFDEPTNPDCSFTGNVINLTRSQPCFDAVNGYHFLDESLRYLNETLGITAMPYQYQGGIKFDPHGVDGSDNSYYSSESGALSFGEGGVDDAQDHDVVLHELGHGIHDWVTHGQLSQVEGLSEGAGDYWASSYSRQFMTDTSLNFNFTFSFDGHNEFWPGRLVNLETKYPVGGLHGEIHDDGQVWATTCMQVNQDIGREKADRIFWSAMAMLDSTSSQADAARAFVKAARELYPDDTAVIASATGRMRDRGYPIGE